MFLNLLTPATTPPTAAAGRAIPGTLFNTFPTFFSTGFALSIAFFATVFAPLSVSLIPVLTPLGILFTTAFTPFLSNGKAAGRTSSLICSSVKSLASSLI